MSSPASLYLDQQNLARRLLDLTNRTGYEILQKHGQRIYGGPPPGWTGPQPDKGTEVYCYRIPRDCFEDELVPVFSLVGEIYELRLMIEFSGTNRSYCYVRYTTQEEAREAIRKLNNYKIRPGHPLAVTRSVDNRKLTIKTVPPLVEETEEEIIHEFNTVVEGVEKVRFQTRGWIEVEFCSHRLAALARRQLVPGNLVLFDKITVKQVDWADPDIDRSFDGEGLGNVIVVGNIPYNTPEYLVANLLNRLSGGQVTNVVKTGSMVLITFVTHEAAVMAMERSKDRELGGATLELSWQNNRRVDRGSYSSMPRIQYMGGQDQGHMADQRFYENIVQRTDMMDLVAQRNLMTAQLARQVSRPPPSYYNNLPETFSGLSLAQGLGQTGRIPLHQPRSRHSSCHTYPMPPPVTSQVFTMSDIQHMPSSKLSLFPSATSMSTTPKPVLAVPPVFRGSGDSQYY